VPKHTSRENLHVSQKPLGLMRYLVETYSNPGDVVLDCFAGSGSTLVAAREVGRRFIGCEMLAENIRTIHARLSQSELFGPLGGGGRGESLTVNTEPKAQNAEVSDGGPLTHDSKQARTRHSLH
jgi:hypothetical protein